MNNKHFYFSLAGMNIKKSSKFYIPYLLTFVATVMMYYMIYAISINKNLPGGGSLAQMMSFGVKIISIFSVIFLFYTNSFLIKRRKKEFGLYHILGMEKKHIAKVLFCESLIVSGAGIIFGLGIGILFQKLLLLTLCRFIKMVNPIKFEFAQEAIIWTVVLFLGIFLLTYVCNVFQLARTKTIELLQGENIGEREPKTKWIMAWLGVVMLGIGYALALTVKNPLEAFVKFFEAVILVIFGTYFLFMAGSIVILKALRANRAFYYKTSHFTAVSGMLYRMKQNAAGLASICILSSMVLVAVSTTTCLYAGVGNAINMRCPYDFEVEKSDVALDWDSSRLYHEVEKVIEENCEIEHCVDYKSLSFAAKFTDADFEYSKEYNYVSTEHVNYHEMQIFTADAYRNITGKTAELEGNEIYVYDTGEKCPEKLHIFTEEYEVKKYIGELDAISQGTAIVEDVHYIVVADNATMEKIYEEQKQFFGDAANSITYCMDINVKGSNEKQLQTFKKLQGMEETKGSMVTCKVEHKEAYYAIYGGFLFLGLFLGAIFIMATTLIIYYKQISEGYDDKERFEIMQKVGMSKKEVKASIRSQVILVFFLPLVTAVIHVCVAFPMIRKLLKVLNMTDTEPFMWYLGGTVAVFAVLYAIVYSLTARTYYNIVK